MKKNASWYCSGKCLFPTLRQRYPSMKSRDEVVNKYGAVEGGKQQLSKLEAYVKANLTRNRIP